MRRFVVVSDDFHGGGMLQALLGQVRVALLKHPPIRGEG